MLISPANCAAALAAADGRRRGTGPSDVICEETDDTTADLVDLASRATTLIIVGGDGLGVSLRCQRAWVEGRSSFPSLLDGSAGQSGTAAPDLDGGGGRGGDGDSNRLELMFLPRSIADLLRIGSREDPDLPLPGGAFFPVVQRPEAACEQVTACVPCPRPLRAEDAL